MQPFSSFLLYTLLFSILNCFGIVTQINSQTVRRKLYLYEGTTRAYLFLIVPPKQIPFVTEWGSPWDEASKVGGLSTTDQPILALDLPVYGEYTYYPCYSYRFD